MVKQFETVSELFEYVRKYDVSSQSSLKDVLQSYKIDSIEINQLFGEIKSGNDFLLLDARSEKENNESSIPFSKNFPVLNNEERHNVGLIYKKYSTDAALKLAMEYADPKAELLGKFLRDNNAEEKRIIIHCWRGGGRSKYLAKMITDLGFAALILTGGMKSYRGAVNEFFGTKPFPYKLLEVSGITGSGKTELLNLMKDEFPVIDLELAARHYSSLFGFVPYKIKNFNPVTNQSAFENNIFGQIISAERKFGKIDYFLVESESKKVGDFIIPQSLFEKINTAQSVKVISSLDRRISRINKDYFEDDLRGIPEMNKILTDKARFFRQEMSNAVYETLLESLNKKDIYTFTRIMMESYYDLKYKDKGKTPLKEIYIDNSAEAVKNFAEFLKSPLNL